MSDPYLEKIAQEKHLHECEKEIAEAKKRNLYSEARDNTS